MRSFTPTYLIGTPTGDINTQTVSVNGVTTASTGNGLKLVDYRFDDSGQKCNIYGTLTDNAHVHLYIYPFPGNTTVKHLEAVISVGSLNFVSATNSFSEVLNGPFWGIEAQKVGTSGSATAIAYI